MKLRTIAPVLNILLCFSVYTSLHPYTDARAKHGGGFAGAIGAAVGGIFSAVSSWFEGSTESLISDGQNLEQRFKRIYFPINEKIGNFFNVDQLAGAPYNWQAVMPNESLLYDIGITLYKQNISWHDFTTAARSFSEKVMCVRNKISDHINKVNDHSGRDLPMQDELKELKKLESSLSWISAEMNAMYRYLAVTHKGYFKMAQTEWELYREYSREVVALDQSKYNTLQLERDLSAIITDRYSSNRYAFIKYYEDLMANLRAIVQARDAVPYDKYPERCKWTDKLIATLSRLASIVEPWYRYEMSKCQNS